MQEFKQIASYWNERYSQKVKEYRPFKISEDFKRFASVFAPGNSYYYIVNLHNFKLEFLSDSVEQYVKKDPSRIELNDLLLTVVPGEIDIISLKSRVISDFYTNFLDKEDVLNYKNMFTYRMKDLSGTSKTMLYQAFPLSVLDTGAPEHVFCLNTDVSHLKVSTSASVSFLHMNGGKNYYNVDISTGMFSVNGCDKSRSDLSELLSEREKQIVIKFSVGLNADQIANELNLSPHTIKTHRRNILRKSECTNTTELVAKCLTSGIISPV